MPCADNDHVVSLGICECVGHLPMQNVLKILSSMSSALALPTISPKQSRLLRSGCETSSSGLDAFNIRHDSVNVLCAQSSDAACRSLIATSTSTVPTAPEYARATSLFRSSSNPSPRSADT